MRRVALVLAVLAAAAAGGRLAFASNLGAVSAQRLTAYSASSTVPTTTCANSTLTDDTWLDFQKSNQLHGTDTSLTIAPGTSKQAWPLVKLTPCAPANAYIVGATLQLHLATSPGAGRTYGAYPITSTWSETTAKASNAPTIAAAATDSVAVPTAAGAMSWNVGADVQTAVNGGTYFGWAIKDPGAGTGTPAGAFDSKELTGGTPATLSITYYP